MRIGGLQLSEVDDGVSYSDSSYLKLEESHKRIWKKSRGCCHFYNKERFLAFDLINSKEKVSHNRQIELRVKHF